MLFNEKITKYKDIKNLKEKLKEKKNFKICISNNADWKNMDHKLFAINESEKALKKVIFYFKNGLYSWVKEAE